MDTDVDQTILAGTPQAQIATLLELHRANLADLEIRAASYSLDVPLPLANGIKFERAQIRIYAAAIVAEPAATAMEGIGEAGRAQVLYRRVDRMEAELQTLAAYNQQELIQRQAEVDARADKDATQRLQRQAYIDKRDNRREWLLWFAIALLTFVIVRGFF